VSTDKRWYKTRCRIDSGIALLILYIDDRTVDDLGKDPRFSEIGPVSEGMAEKLNEAYADEIATERCIQITVPPWERK
jgi:hypothetical protein